MVVLLLYVGGLTGCTSGGDGDGWRVGEGDADTTADTGSTTIDGDGELVCGEPDQVIETVEAAAELAPCDVYRGSFDLRLGETEYTDLTMFPGFRVIRGTLKIYGGGELTSVAGLENLERVGELNLSGFVHLEDYSGLSNLRRVDGLFKLQHMSPRNFEGFESLRSTGDVLIISMPNLDTVRGLDSLERVRGKFWLTSTGDLSQSEVESFLEGVQVDGEVRINTYTE